MEVREKDGMLELLKMAAWRGGEEQQTVEPVSGKRENTGVLYVFGNMSLVLDAPVKSGSYERALGKKDCVVTSSLTSLLLSSGFAITS